MSDTEQARTTPALPARLAVNTLPGRDYSGNVYADCASVGRLVLSKQHGYDSEDSPAIAEMVRRYNAHDKMLAMLKEAEQVADGIASFINDPETTDRQIGEAAETLADLAMRCRAALAAEETT